MLRYSCAISLRGLMEKDRGKVSRRVLRGARELEHLREEHLVSLVLQLGAQSFADRGEKRVILL